MTNRDGDDSDTAPDVRRRDLLGLGVTTQLGLETHFMSYAVLCAVLRLPALLAMGAPHAPMRVLGAPPLGGRSDGHAAPTVQSLRAPTPMALQWPVHP